MIIIMKVGMIGLQNSSVRNHIRSTCQISYLKERKKKNDMNIIAYLFLFVSFVCSSLSAKLLIKNNCSRDSSIVMDSIAPAFDRAQRERLTSIRKMIIAKFLSEKDINNRINMLGGEYSEYDAYLTVYADGMAPTLDWNLVFTELCEYNIRQYYKDSTFEDDFPIRLKIIIKEIHHDMYKCYEYNQADEFYSCEMINIIHFLEENCLEYYTEYVFEMIVTVIDFLHIHSLKARRHTDAGISNTIKEKISRIKKYDKEFREFILPKSRSMLILNNIVDEISGLRIALKVRKINNNANSFIISNIIRCHENVNKACKNQSFLRRIPSILSIKYKETINMEELYKNLDKIKKNWKGGKYSDEEYRRIFFLYIISFSFDNFCLVGEFNNPSGYMRDLHLIHGDNRYGLLSSLISLIPNSFTNIFDKCHINTYQHSCLYKICYQNLLKILDYREYLLNEDSDKLIHCISDLEPEESFKSMKAIIGCYKAYSAFKHENIIETSRIAPYDIESLCDICSIILIHLENIDSSFFEASMYKYVDLCYALKDFTEKTIDGVKENSSEQSDNIINLLEFYEGYHKTGLQIDCIYNICFLLDKSGNNIVSRFSSVITPNIHAIQFYDAAHVFIEHLRDMNYNISTYDEETHDTLDHLMKCLIEMKQGNYDNICLHIGYTLEECDFIINSVITEVSVQSCLDVIEYKFWPNIYFYTDVLSNLCDPSCGIKTLYEAKYVSETDIKKLYYVLCDFVRPSGINDMGILRLGVLNRKNKTKMNELLCDIIINSLRLIKIAHDRDEDLVFGLDAAQYLFRNINDTYLKKIAHKAVSILNLTNDNIIENEILRLLEVLGIYALFENVQKSCLFLFRAMTLIVNFLLNKINISASKRCAFKVLLIYSDYPNSSLKKSIKKPNEDILYELCKELQNIFEALETEENSLMIVSKMLVFVSNISCITDNYTIDDIKYIIVNMIVTFDMMIYQLNSIILLADILLYTMKIRYMVNLVSIEIEKIQRKTVVDFINCSCSVIIELSEKIDMSRIAKTTEISNFINLRDRFLEITDNLESFMKCEILSLLIYWRIEKVLNFYNLKNICFLIKIIGNIASRNQDTKIKHFKFFAECYEILKRFFLGLDDNLDDDQLFLEICSLLKKDRRLLESMGYIVTEPIEDIKCYLCYVEISGAPVRPLNCVCKTYLSDFICLMRYDLSKFIQGYSTEFVPVCCICRK